MTCMYFDIFLIKKKQTVNGDGMKMGTCTSWMESIISIPSVTMNNIKNSDRLIHQQLFTVL
jgi:hypothetical protein